MPADAYPPHAFRTFSERLDQTPLSRDAAVKLQNLFRADINLVWFCCWCGAEGPGVLEPAFLAEMIDHTAGWNDDVVKHLRVTRWVLDRGFPEIDDAVLQTLSQSIQTVEVEAEHVERLTLAQCVDELPRPHPACGPSTVGRNLIAYLRLLNIENNDVADNTVADLLRGVFPQLSLDSARSLLAFV